MDSSATVLQSVGKSSAAERLRDTHRLLVVLVMAHAGEEVDAQGAAGGHRKIGDGPPLVHLSCGSGRGRVRRSVERSAGCAVAVACVTFTPDRDPWAEEDEGSSASETGACAHKRASSARTIVQVQRGIPRGTF